jgi:hypothetical protein
MAEPSRMPEVNREGGLAASIGGGSGEWQASSTLL